MTDAPPLNARVAAVVQASSVDRTFTFTLDQAERCATWIPGQYLLLRVLAEDPPKDRPYSLSSAPSEGAPQITVRGGGDWGRAVYELQVGDHVALAPPAGEFHVVAEPTHDVVLVAGGSGITPFRAALAAWTDAGSDARIVLFHTCTSHDRLVFEADFRAFEERLPNFVYRPLLTQEAAESPWRGVRGRLDRNALATRLRDGQATLLYACGPGALVEDVMTWGVELGIPASNCRKESW